MILSVHFQNDLLKLELELTPTFEHNIGSLSAMHQRTNYQIIVRKLRRNVITRKFNFAVDELMWIINGLNKNYLN